MKSIVILGAGTGGTLVANMLRSQLSDKDWSITIIDKGTQHLYQPGLLFLPFQLYGYTDESDIVRPIRKPLPERVGFVQAEVRLIDRQQRKVETTEGDYAYDFLVSALGCYIAPHEVEGLAESMGRGVHTFYDLQGALDFRQPLAEMRAGRLVVDIAEMPIKCPVAPIEFCFLADYYFEQRGVRDDIEITLVTPYTGAFTKPVANRILSQVAQEKRIDVVPNFAIESVDAEHKVIRAFDGNVVNYDMLCSIPPNLGPDVADDSELGDGAGYFLTDPRTLQARKAERIYVLGDNSNVATSKAGSVAHFEAETVVENILREIDGETPLPSFDGHANCFVETGHHKAMLLDFNYDVEPLQGDFPMPGFGPFSLLQESYINHMGKIAFDWVYWHMLLPGYLPHVPMLPAHMSFLGKDLNQAPQIRSAKGTSLGSVMRKNVVTVTRGAPLAEAARLMSENHVSGLPVVDVDGRLAGIVTEADFLSALNVDEPPAISNLFDTIIRRRRARKRMGTIVDDIMTPDPITLKATDSLQRAVEIMDRNKIKRIVVTDDAQHVAGIVSRADLPRLFLGK